jgi:hypothetical protein
VPMKERHIQIALKRTDMTADSRLTYAQRLAGMGKAARFRGSVKHFQLIPVHP